MLPIDKKIPTSSLAVRIDHYLNHRLPEIMKVNPNEVKVKEVRSGRNTELRLIELPEKGKVMLRFYPFRRQKCRGYEHYYLSNLLQGLGVLVPEVLWLDNNKQVLKAYRVEVVAEEFIAGKELTKDFLTPAGINNLLRIILKLHNKTVSIPGKPWQRVNEKRYPLAYLRQRSWLYLSRVKDKIAGVNKQSIKEFWTAINKELAQLKAIKDFNLVHGDFHFRNLLLDNKKRYT